MAQLYGLGNYVMTEIGTKLMLNPEFNKFVYYTDNDEDGDSILSLPDLENPIELLSQGKVDERKVFLNRRPEKILHRQDVNVFLFLEDMKNYTAVSKRIKTIFVKIGVLVHDECIKTPNGSRDICIASAIEKILENSKFGYGIGSCEIVRVNSLFGLPVEYTGYEILCKIDGFTRLGTIIDE